MLTAEEIQRHHAAWHIGADLLYNSGWYGIQPDTFYWEVIHEQIDIAIDMGLSYRNVVDWLAHIADSDHVAPGSLKLWVDAGHTSEPLRPRHLAEPGTPIGPNNCLWSEVEPAPTPVAPPIHDRKQLEEWLTSGE
ncbi:MAG TPA: hypothetical protein PLZ93_01675 [Nocardioides sp.]|nr:hypothetical protein [Nocardioides sp.]HRK44250.1 hypothetical protein [Nocardioides sp.]